MTWDLPEIALIEDHYHHGSYRLPWGDKNVCTAQWTDNDALCLRIAAERIGDNWLCQHHANRLEEAVRRKSERRAREDGEAFAQARLDALAKAEAESVVYYLQRADELIKIGFSSQFTKRLAALRSEHGPLATLATHQGGREVEKIMHRRFAEDRVEGEWFLPSDELLAHIALVASRQEKRERVAA